MNYRDYMAQHALLDETKFVLNGRMKQRAQQLRAAGAAPARRTVPAVISPKKNTLRLHPIRWAAIFTSIALVATATPVLAIFVPRAIRDGNTMNSIHLQYMENLMVDTEGVTAYSIRREGEVEAVSATSFAARGGESKAPAVSLLSGQLVEKEGGVSLAKTTQDRNYLYSTTASYEAGNVEYDETGITKVTFMKNREVTEDVYDNNGELIGSDRRIAQEELDAQINRIYTTERFTFVQYVAMVEKTGDYGYKDVNGEVAWEHLEIRPDGLEYDENGTAVFDAGGFNRGNYGIYELNVSSYSSGAIRVISPENPAYYTGALSASFVIDNTTGYIYKIEGLKICGFVNGLVVDSTESAYTVSVDAENNLVFTDVMPNKDVEVYDAFMGNDGWTYVRNDTLDETVRARKMIYYTIDDYVQDKEGNAYIVGKLENISYPTLTHKMVNGVPTPFENHGLLKLRIGGGILGMYDNISILEDGSARGKEGTGLYVYMAGEWFDDNFDMLLGESYGKLYYCLVDLSECVDKMVTITSDEFTPLCDFDVEKAEDYYMSVGNDRYKVENVYRHKEANETKYYRVVRAETGLVLEELTSKSYADNVFIFQPINK